MEGRNTWSLQCPLHCSREERVGVDTYFRVEGPMEALSGVQRATQEGVGKG